MEAVIALMFALLSIVHGRCDEARMRTVARAVAEATPHRHERAALVVVSWLESRFGRDGDLLFGVIACRRRGCDAAQEARSALGGLRGAWGVCGGPAWIPRFSRYHNGSLAAGRCVEDAYGVRAANLLVGVSGARVMR